MIEWLRAPWAWGWLWTRCVNCGKRFWRSFPPYCFEEHCCQECANEEYEFINKMFGDDK